MSEKFQIHLQGTADAQQWVQAETQLKKLDSAASDFLNSLKAGVGIDLGGRLVNGVAQLQGLFTGFAERGYEFNKTMAQSEGGIANVLAKFMKLDQQAAKQEAAKAMAAIMEWEPKAAGSLQDLTLGFMSTVGAGQAAGITVAQNVELVGKFANALAALGMDASQLTQELRAIFTGNITSDAQLAKTLQITPEAVRSAKEAGTFYEYLNKQLGSLGNTAKGPAVTLSSLNSAIDIAAGVLSKPLFNELIQGAEELTTLLNQPDAKNALEELGVSIGALVHQGVNLTLWAVENGPVLLTVAEVLFKIGAAVTAIKLTEIVAGLVLKAQRWAMVTTAVTQNTAALAANSSAASANAALGVGANPVRAAVPSVTANAEKAGAAGGKAMGNSMVSAFTGIAQVGLNVALIAAVTYAFHAAQKYIEAEAAMAAAQAEAKAKLETRYERLTNRGTAPTKLAVTAEEKSAATAEAGQSLAALQKMKDEMLRQIIESRRIMGSTSLLLDPETFRSAEADAASAEIELNKIDESIGKINTALARMDSEEGALQNLKTRTQAAEEAEKAFNAALLAGQAAAGDNAAKIQLASSSVEAYAKKLSEAAGLKVDTSSFESLLNSLQGLDKLKLDEQAMKDVTALIDAAGKLRDLKADAAKEAEQQADKAKKAADDLRDAEIKKLELQSRAAEAANKPALARDLKARAEALQLRSELEAQGMTPDTAAGVVKAEQGKAQADAAKEAADKAEQIRKEQERKALAVQVAALEDEIAQKRAEGDKQGEQAAQDRLAALQLARQLEEQLDLTRAEAEARAQRRIENERAASDREAFKGQLGDGVGRSSGPARLSAADTWGDGRKASGLRGDGSSSIAAFNERQNTPLRDAFQFPALDAFAAAQPAAAGATPQKEGTAGSGDNMAGAAKQAAEAAAKAREATAKSDAVLLAEFQKLSSELTALAAQQQETSSQLAHSRA